MRKKSLLEFILVLVVTFGFASNSNAGSERMIMNMTAEGMEQSNLIHVRFLNAHGKELGSDVIKRMVIRDQDCSSGHIYKIARDYKIGYAVDNMLVGVYLPPWLWEKKPLCFSVPQLGMAEQTFDPSTSKSRNFSITVAP